MSKGKPDLENGYFRLSNEFYDALLIYKLNQTQRLVMDALIRKLWGWQKKEDDVSLSQLAIMTRLKEPHISIALNDLAKFNLIEKKRGRYGQSVSINKYYRTWQGWETDWEYWHKDSDEQKENITKKPEPELTHEQLSCWEWAKTSDYWQAKVATQSDFLKLYSRHNSGEKTQYEAFKNKSKQRINGKKHPDEYVRRKISISRDDDYIDGNCEVVNE